MTVFTSGEWHVKAGREQEFQRIWTNFGGLTGGETEAGVGAVLLRDKQDPLHFRSFGHWPDEEAAARWQATPSFARWMADIRETVDQLESSVFEVAQTVGENADLAQPVRR